MSPADAGPDTETDAGTDAGTGTGAPHGAGAARRIADAPAEPAEPAGVLRLEVRKRAGRSVAVRQYHQGALRVLRPHYPEGTGGLPSSGGPRTAAPVAYTVINPGGAYFGADHYLMDVAVGAGAGLVLTTQSATKVYRTPQGPARQDLHLRLGAGAVLEYVPDQLIVYRGGSYRQRTLVEADPTASLLMAEIVTPGWSPEGEPFRYDLLGLRTEVRLLPGGGLPEPGDPADSGAGAPRPGGRRLVVDQLRIAPGEQAGLHGVGLMEGFSHTGTLLVADPGLDEALYEEMAALVEAAGSQGGTLSGTGAGSQAGNHGGVRAGITRAGLDGTDGMRCVAIRSLAHSTGTLARLHQDLGNLLRSRLRGQGPLELRKP